ncbi:MAG TPA: CoA transferase [Chloroflexota bacterium]|jgi:crotonobetainyl-CoA:carnitine CoA-transferase CaiB-like acyl-CoA transferase
MRVLELGNYVSVAYAGMLLAEQGFEVTKWVAPEPARDPILGLDHGDELWAWINAGKTLVARRAHELAQLPLGDVGIVLDNVRPATLASWGIEPATLAQRWAVVWVSLRSEVGERSFDVVAQARSWMEYGPWLPIYLGDTTAGLMMAFKALAKLARHEPGHYVLGQASCLQKLVEGELVVDAPLREQNTRWDLDEYWAGPDGAHVCYRGELLREPIRDRAWKLEHLYHDGAGRIRL